MPFSHQESIRILRMLPYTTIDPHLTYTSGLCSQQCQFFTRGLFECNIDIADLWQYYVFCIRSDVARSTIFMVLNLCQMCQCELHEVPLLHICIFMCLLAAVPHNTAGLILISVSLWNDPCQHCIRWCGTRVSRVWQMFFYWPNLLAPFLYFPVFPFSYFFLLVSVVGLGLRPIGCQTFSLCLALPTFF